MKNNIKFVLFVMPLLILVMACDSNNNSDLECSFDEFKERLANTECLAEEFIRGCKNIGCFSTDQQIEFANRNNSCTVIDCETLTCERIFVRSGTNTTTFPGELIDLSIDPETELPIGIFLVNDMESEFSCGLFVP